MATLPVKSPCTLTIISRGSPLILLIVAVHGGCCRIFGIWNNRLPSYPFWNIIWGIIGWVPTRAISLWPSVFLEMSIFTTLVTSHILPGRLPSSISTTIFTAIDPEINLLQSLVDRLINGHSVCLRKWRLVLRLFFAGSRFPPLLIHNIVVFSCSFLYKGIIGCELILWYDIHVTHTNFLDKLRNFLVLLNKPQRESGVRSILKDVSDVP